ncbi:MAG: response regulator transcription factor [Bacteroidia bacterium]|nr:response regulator transcription factor [Bacteroidia bacterium]
MIICDINLPEIDGIELTQQIKLQYPQVKVIILSMHDDRHYILRAVEAQVDGYLHKDIFEQELIEGIKTVYQGEKYFSKGISQIIINTLFNKESEADNPYELTAREREVLKLITDGYKNREIADKLFISTKTVDKHRANLLQKLNVRNTAELVKFAIQKQLV